MYYCFFFSQFFCIFAMMRDFYTYKLSGFWTLSRWRHTGVYILTVPEGVDIDDAKTKLSTLPGHTIFITNPICGGSEIFFKSILSSSKVREAVVSLFHIPKNTREHKDRKRYKRPIYQYTLDGEFVKKWDGVVDIVRELGYNQGNIVSCARGRYKQSYGFLWKYT